MRKKIAEWLFLIGIAGLFLMTELPYSLMLVIPLIVVWVSMNE